MSTTEQKIKSLISTLGKVPKGKIVMKSDIRKLGIDSLMALELVAKLEKTFRVHIPESKIRSIGRVDQIVREIDALRGQGQKAIHAVGGRRFGTTVLRA